MQRRLAILNSLLKPEIPKRKQYVPLRKTTEKSESTYRGDAERGENTDKGEKAPKSEKKHVVWKRHLTSKVEKSESKLSAKDPAVEYTLDTWMRGFRTAPLCTVRNRGIYYYYGSVNFNKAEDEKALEVRVYEKKYESNIDLTMGVLDENGSLTHGNTITEWMANYPSYSTVQGDKQSGEPYETNARFDYTENTSQKFDIGVEIDLDHKLQRLRRTVGMSIKNGPDPEAVHPFGRHADPSRVSLSSRKLGDFQCRRFLADLLGLRAANRSWEGRRNSSVERSSIRSVCVGRRFEVARKLKC